MKKTILIILCLVSFILSVRGQMLKNFIPQSPTASSLGIFGDIPVSYYSGLPNTSVPLFTLPLSGLDFSCALNYSADGLRVLAESSNVGLNWAISNTGVITRNLRTIDDFSSNGYFKVRPSDRKYGAGKDLEPDIFNYNFNGKTGKFLIDYTNGQGYNIKFLSKSEDLVVEIIDGSNFKITDNQGNVYKFEKRENQTQRTTINSDPPGATISYVSAWYLTSVLTANRDELTISYKSNTAKIVNDYRGRVVISIDNISNLPQCARVSGGVVDRFYDTHRSTTSVTHTETDEVLVDQITYKGGKVYFDYLPRTDLQTTDNIRSSYLSSITVRNSNQTIVKYLKFDYDYFTAPGLYPSYVNKRLKLEKLAINTNDNAYHFLYDESGPFPIKSSDVGNSYNSNPVIGLLKKMYYPTGGYTEFEYERQGSRIGTYNFIDYTGARIKKIINKEVNDSILDIKRFDYSKTIDNKLVSSGISLTPSMYLETDVFNTTCDNALISIKYTTRYLNNVLPSDYGNPIGYDEVTVYHGENGENGKSIYYFRNEIDQYPQGQFPGAYGARDVGNGILTSEEHYKKNTLGQFIIVSKKDIDYESINPSTVSGAKIVGNGLNYYHVYTGNYRQIAEKEYIYSDNASTFVKTTNYAYNGFYLQPKHIETINSNGDIQKLIKRNAYDMVQLRETVPYQQMLNRNMLSQIIEEEKQVNNVMLSKTITEYSNDWTSNPYLILPLSVKTQYKTESVEARTKYYDYDDVGNTLRASLVNGIPISYKWGYNKQHLVAEFTNAGPEEFFFEDFEGNGPLLANSLNGHTGKGGYSGSISLSNYFQPSNSKTYLLSYFYYENDAWHHLQIPYSGQTISGLIDDITIYPANGKVLTYTYEPAIGLTSAIDASGNTTYYDYDTAHRLEAIRDHNKHIIKSFNYNLVLFKYYNNQKSKRVLKNDCSGGTSAPAVLFSVPSGKYISTVSQADADAQAQNYLDLNGQAYANQNGVCTQSANYAVTFVVDPNFNSVRYTLTKSFNDAKQALCKVVIRYGSTKPGGTFTEVVKEIQMNEGILTYEGTLELKAATSCDVELTEVIEN